MRARTREEAAALIERVASTAQAAAAAQSQIIQELAGKNLPGGNTWMDENGNVYRGMNREARRRMERDTGMKLRRVPNGQIDDHFE